MKFRLHAKRVAIFSSTLVLFATFLFASIAPVSAAVLNPTPQPKVSFTFDDGYASAYTKAAPALQQYGYTGTSYVTTSYVGKTNYMKWANVKALKNSYGWEIGSHSVSHPLMTKLNATKLQNEVVNSKLALQAQGIVPTSFATPFGDYNSNVIAEIARNYTSHRPFHDAGYNTWPYDNYRLQVQQVQSGVSIDMVKSYIDQAANNGTWLVLVFHDIKDNPSTLPDDYEYKTSDLSSIAAYAKAKLVKNVNVTDGMVGLGSSDNMLPSPITGSQLGNGWTTDSPARISVNSANKGAFPEAITSLKVSGSSSSNVHLFSPRVSVNHASSYGLKGYVNGVTLPAEVGFYIDEYDNNGNWISGQYKKTISNNQIKDLSVAYQPSSASVLSARLQIITGANSNVLYYLDNIQWFTSVNGARPVDPTPVSNNLLQNGAFDAGLTGWRTDNTSAIMHDSAGNGSAANPQNSVKLVAGTTTAHLFTDLTTVDSAKTYSISCFANVMTLSSNEIGFYIDEYDINGNWISGKYITGIRSTGTRTVTLAYTPSSSNVKKSSLQVILNANSGITAYMDNFTWVTN
jgi:peptidoglycan/xylan/chitin deacetylase (PgdA/CDA1 family)